MTNLISKSTQCPTVSVFTVWLFITSTPLVSALEARSSSSAEDKFWASTPLVLGILIVLAIAYHFISRYERRVRLHAILEGQEENVRDQSLFLHQRGVSAWLKNHIFYAPLVGKRHARELRIFNIASGIFPMRLEVFCVVLIYVVNLIYFLVGPPGRTFEKLTPSILSVRAGGLATANLLPLLLMSARCNPLTPLTGITFDKWNIGHRWVGRLIAIESILHVVYFAKKLIVKSGEEAGKKAFRQLIIGGTFQGAFIALLLFCALSVHGIAFLRHAFYETFHHVHVILVTAAFVLIYKHTEMSSTAHIFMQIAIALWVADRSVRLILLIYQNVGSRLSKIDAEVLEGECLRLNIKMQRPWNFVPGQYAFLSIPSVGLYMSHPFSVSWCTYEPLRKDGDDIELEDGTHANNHPMPEHMIPTGPARVASMSMLVRRRNGFTDSLYKRVVKAGNQRSFSGFVTGPYGVPHCFDSYGSVVLIAAGVGISHIIPYVRHLAWGYAQQTIATKRIRLVWIIHSFEHQCWIEPWVRAIRDMNGRKHVLHVSVFITDGKTRSTPGLIPGKPNIDVILNEEVAYQIGAMMVSFCGTGSLADDVRKACRDRQANSRIDYAEESFSW